MRGEHGFELVEGAGPALRHAATSGGEGGQFFRRHIAGCFPGQRHARAVRAFRAQLDGRAHGFRPGRRHRVACEVFVLVAKLLGVDDAVRTADFLVARQTVHGAARAAHAVNAPPPTRTSARIKCISHPVGAVQLAMCAGWVHISNISASGASKLRLMTKRSWSARRLARYSASRSQVALPPACLMNTRVCAAASAVGRRMLMSMRVLPSTSSNSTVTRNIGGWSALPPWS